jgi:hypothetical protein
MIEFFGILRHRIIDRAAVERLAAQDAPNTQKPAAPSTMPQQSLAGILRAAWLETTAGRLQKTKKPAVEGQQYK